MNAAESSLPLPDGRAAPATGARLSSDAADNSAVAAAAAEAAAAATKAASAVAAAAAAASGSDGDRTLQCACGNFFMADSLFCRKCGAPRPKKCSCGWVFASGDTSAYCQQCGQPRPVNSPPRIDTSNAGAATTSSTTATTTTTTPLSAAGTPLPVITLDGSDPNADSLGGEPPQRPQLSTIMSGKSWESSGDASVDGAAAAEGRSSDGRKIAKLPPIDLPSTIMESPSKNVATKGARRTSFTDYEEMQTKMRQTTMSNVDFLASPVAGKKSLGGSSATVHPGASGGGGGGGGGGRGGGEATAGDLAQPEAPKRKLLMSPLRKGRSFHDEAAAARSDRRRSSVDGMSKATKAIVQGGGRRKSRNGIFSFLFPSTRDVTPRSRAPIKLVKEWERYQKIRAKNVKASKGNSGGAVTAATSGFPAGIVDLKPIPDTLMTEWDATVERQRDGDRRPALDRLSMTVDEKYPFVGPEVLYLGCKVKFVMGLGTGGGGGDGGGGGADAESGAATAAAAVPVGEVARVDAAMSPGGTTVSDTERVFTVVWTPAQNLLDAMKTSIELVRQNQTMVEAMPTAVGSVAANPNPGIPV